MIIDCSKTDPRASGGKTSDCGWGESLRKSGIAEIVNCAVVGFEEEEAGFWRE